MLSLAENDELDRLAALQERKGRFVLFHELQAEGRKDWLVHNFLGAGDASAFYGKPGDGKSVLAEDLALHISAGRDWLGRTVKQGAVVYVALERRKLVERRATAFGEKHGLTDLPFAIVGGMHDFRNPRTAEWLAEVVAEVEQVTGFRVVLVIIDTLSRALCGGDENSSKDVGAIVAATSVLQATGAHVMWVHHVPLDSAERLRGHGALLGALDTTVCVAKVGAIRTATVVKSNDSEEGERVAFTLESVVIGHDEAGDTMAPIVVAAEPMPVQPVRSAARLPKAAQSALRALVEAIDEQGKVPPPSSHVPTGVRVVTIGQWRQQAYRRGISTSNEERARQQAFKRSTENLIGIGRVGIWNDQAWLV